MATKGQMTGMQGVFLVAAELTKRGFVVSPTSRSSFGADLLVADQECKRAWSVQVKTNSGRPTFWLLNKHSSKTKSDSHVYVLVNLRQKNQKQLRMGPELYVVPSHVVARRMRTTPRSRSSIFYSIWSHDLAKYKDNWGVFGTAAAR
ncbi:MAG TPA: hypothetical protein VKB26_08760 [Candidatus Acidoferrales bacterium]|nr:hypothetical protein [Candidatus Acidoferrales bacterium]